MTQQNSSPDVALFVTCLVDLFRPNVGFSTVKLLEDAGCKVHVPVAQTCCGQPAWNSGDRADTKDIAMQVIKNFEGFDYVVLPSGSCAGMMKTHYPELFEEEDPWHEKASKFSEKVFEITSFLTDVMGVESVDASLSANVTYHDSCAGLRELGISGQPRKLLETVKGVNLTEMKDCTTCCGFGGTFSVKYSDISNSIVESKTTNIKETNADMMLAGDMGCLLNMAGKLKREGSTIEVRHVVEVLAGMTDNAAIGEASPRDRSDKS